MTKFDHHDGYTPSQRSAEEAAIDQETEGQTFWRMVIKYRRELLAGACGGTIAIAIIWAFNTFIIV